MTNVIERLRAVLEPIDDGWDRWEPFDRGEAEIMAYHRPTYMAAIVKRIRMAALPFSLAHVVRRAFRSQQAKMVAAIHQTTEEATWFRSMPR